jgi:hypothetical protein
MLLILGWHVLPPYFDQGMIDILAKSREDGLNGPRRHVLPPHFDQGIIDILLNHEKMDRMSPTAPDRDFPQA